MRGKLMLLLSALIVCLLYKANDHQTLECPPPRVERVVATVVAQPDVLEQAVPKKTPNRNHIEERNRLSRLMNRLKREMAQQLCEQMQHDKGSANETDLRAAEHGDLCLRDVSRGKPLFDKNLTQEMARLMEGGRAAQFGDGTGMYKRHMDVLSLLASYDSYDGNPYIENITKNAVRFLDLSVPVYGLPLYDWVVCLHVHLHAPRETLHALLDNIARHARTGVILGWAKGGQDAPHASRSQDPHELQRLMKDKGFTVDVISSTTLMNAAFRPWFRTNVRVYERDPAVTAEEDEA